MIHKLKTIPAPFRAIEEGHKRFELRKEDRGHPYAVGDTLVLQEWEPDDRPGLENRGSYTGRELQVTVTTRLGPAGVGGLEEGWAILGIIPKALEAGEKCQWCDFAAQEPLKALPVLAADLMGVPTRRIKMAFHRLANEVPGAGPWKEFEPDDESRWIELSLVPKR